MVYIDILIKFLQTNYKIRYSYHVKLRTTCKIIQYDYVYYIGRTLIKICKKNVSDIELSFINSYQ